jgi:hypothetical protein
MTDVRKSAVALMADIAVAIEGGLMLPAGKFFTRGRPASEGARHGTAEGCETAVLAVGEKAGIVDDPGLDRTVPLDLWQHHFAHLGQHLLVHRFPSPMKCSSD